MKRLSILIGVIMCSYVAIAQYPGGTAGGARRGFGGQVPSIGHFYGKIVDEKTNKGLDGVSVQLIQTKFDQATKKTKDTVVSGMITESKGNFSLENLPIFGNFRLKITAIGYKIHEQKVGFDIKFQQGMDMQQALNNVDKDLGNIKLQADAQMLGEVVVTGSKPLVQLGIDRKIYNVEKDISAAGGSAVDIMKNVPSVAVDIDGNVTLRNSTPTIFVDGRPTTLTLDQIPADAIQSIEIITNPGAKYDASGGTSGILNIVLKKNRKAGYNGNLRAGIDERGKFNAGGDINVKQGKVNVFANLNYNERKSITTGTTTRNTFTNNTLLTEYDNNVNNGAFLFGRLGLDYFLDNRNTISVSGTAVHGHFTPYIQSDIYVDTLNANGDTTSSYTYRLSNTAVDFRNMGGMLSFKHTFPHSGEEWTADANYSKGTNSSTNVINSYYYDTKGSPLLSVYDQQQLGSGTNEYITAQTDFVNPISDKSKIEAGARAAIRNVSSTSDLGVIDKNGNVIPEPLLSSDYNYHDKVFAGYLTYSNAIKNFGYQLGLRAESSMYNGKSNYATKDSASGAVIDTVGVFSNEYPIDLFPSIFLSQKLGGQQELQLNYTRRIDRPSFFQLFPFTDYSDSLNLSRGNPNLKPQFTNSFELSYQKTYKGNNTFLASVYFKYTTDVITRYQTKETNPLTDSVVFVNTYINGNSSFVGGLELIGRNSVTKWWDITSNINIFTSKINAGDSIQTTPQTWSWFGKINNSFKLPKNFTIQLSGDYTSKTVLPPGGSAGTTSTGGRGWGPTVSGNSQGYSNPTGGVDIAVKYEFLKNKAASITLSVSDIFRTRVSDVFTDASYFTQEVYRRRDPQFFRLQFNYRFGKFDANLFKRKNQKGDLDSMQNSMQGVQQ
ncbi:MAG TPA: outer membrane beta-barrel family protein [Puia sp.]|nr:outer membrane beta-barrel family protein [Puia sp.]